LAGHETTANTTSFVLMELCLHPEIMEAVYQEVKEVKLEKGHEIETLSKLR
jgi:cytochrome P450